MQNKKIRTATIYLVFSRSKYMDAKVRMTSRTPSIETDERFMKLDLEIPDRIFDTPQFSGKLKIPDNAAGQVEIDLTQMQDYFQDQFGIKITITKDEELS